MFFINILAFLKGKGSRSLAGEVHSPSIQLNRAFYSNRIGVTKAKPPQPEPQLSKVSDLLAIRAQSLKLQNWLECEAQTSLLEVAQSLHNRPEIELICVRKQSKGLVGLVRRERLNWELLYRVAPARVIKDLSYSYPFFNYSACISDRTIGAIMHHAAFLELSDTIEEACLQLRLHQAEVLPILDAAGQIVACLRLSELVDFWTIQHCHNLGEF